MSKTEYANFNNYDSSTVSPMEESLNSIVTILGALIDSIDENTRTLNSTLKELVHNLSQLTS